METSKLYLHKRIVIIISYRIAWYCIIAILPFSNIKEYFIKIFTYVIALGPTSHLCSNIIGAWTIKNVSTIEQNAQQMIERILLVISVVNMLGWCPLCCQRLLIWYGLDKSIIFNILNICYDMQWNQYVSYVSIGLCIRHMVNVACECYDTIGWLDL